MDHIVFINWLRSRYGVGGSPLNWLSSYFHNKSQSVLIGDVRSQPVLVDFVYPRGSVCGSICFILNTAALESIITRHGLSVSMSALNRMQSKQLRTVSKMSKHGCHSISWFWTIAKLKLYTSRHDYIHLRNYLPSMINVGEATVWTYFSGKLMSTLTWSNMSTTYVVVLPFIFYFLFFILFFFFWARLENCGNTSIRSQLRNSFRRLSSVSLTILTLFCMIFHWKTFVSYKES